MAFHFNHSIKPKALKFPCFFYFMNYYISYDESRKEKIEVSCNLISVTLDVFNCLIKNNREF